MTQEGPDLAGPSGEKGPTDYSGPTLRDVVRHMQMAAGCPDPDTESAVTLAQISEVQSVEVVTWVLQEWARGRLEAYDPGSLMPILTPRMCQNPRIEWNYVAGSIPNLGLGGSVRLGKLPGRLPSYGTFRFESDGNWSFLLHGSDRPVIRRIATDRPAIFAIPIQLEAPGAEESTSLLLRVERDPNVGLTVSAEYGGLRWQGISRAIHDLAQDCMRAKVFSRDVVGHRDAALWSNAVAWFLSMVFSRDLPIRMTDLAEEGSPENEVIRQARSAIAVRLATMIFHKDRVEEAVTSFREHLVPLFPESAGHQIKAPEEVSEHVVNPQPTGWDTTGKADGDAESHSAADDGAPDICALMAEKLPDLLPRSKLPRLCEELLGTKLIGKSTLEKLDMRNEGPPKLVINGRIHYRKEEFVRWYRCWNFNVVGTK